MDRMHIDTAQTRGSCPVSAKFHLSPAWFAR
jgi:hypothetical protein